MIYLFKTMIFHSYVQFFRRQQVHKQLLGDKRKPMDAAVDQPLDLTFPLQPWPDEKSAIGSFYKTRLLNKDSLKCESSITHRIRMYGRLMLT